MKPSRIQIASGTLKKQCAIATAMWVSISPRSEKIWTKGASRMAGAIILNIRSPKNSPRWPKKSCREKA